MAYTLYRTTKNSRTYRQVAADGTKTAFCKTTQDVMHYESVPLSGEFDTPVDLAQVVTDNGSIDGFTIVENGWHFGVQTAVAAGGEPDQGTFVFGALGDTKPIAFKCVRFGYRVLSTGAFTALPAGSGDFDYTTAPTWSPVTRNIATFSEVSDVTVTHKNQFEWSNLWNNGAGLTLSLNSQIKGGQFHMGWQLPTATRNWIKANAPAVTDPDDTVAGFLFEVDVSNIDRIYQNGELLSWDDGFTDEAGDIYFRDSSDNLIAIIPRGWANRPNGGFDHRLTNHYYESGGTYYLHVTEENYTLFDLLTSHPYQFQLTLANDETATYSLGGDGNGMINAYRNYSDFSYLGPGNFQYNSLQNSGSYTGVGAYNANNAYDALLRFEPDIPFNASVTGDSEYAKIWLYSDDDYGFYGSAVLPRTWADVGTGDAPKFSTVIGPINPESIFDYGQGVSFLYDPPKYWKNLTTGQDGWMDSVSYEVGPIVNSVGYSEAFVEPIYASGPTEEVASTVGWEPGNGMRFRIAGDPSTNETGNCMWVSSYHDINEFGAVLDVFYTEQPAARKPGFDDTPKRRNKRRSRFAGSGSNDTSYRDGDNDLPNTNTRDNKNRNRFS